MSRGNYSIAVHVAGASCEFMVVASFSPPMHIAQLYCIGWAIVTALSVCPSAAFRYCAKTVLARAMKFGSIMESHTRIPYPLFVLGYDDPKG